MSEEENIYKNKSDEVAENIVAAEGESERKDAAFKRRGRGV